MKNKPFVAVVGGGIAGLSCAVELRKLGLEVLVFDKSRGVAGRMSTRRGEGWQCDHGAQYFTARDPGFRAEVARWQAAGVAAVWQPRLAVMGGSGAHQPDAGLERFVGVPRMTAPARHLADGLDLRLESPVVGLRRDGVSWCLDTLNAGESVARFDAVILAVPAPQAVPLLQPVSDRLAAMAAQVVMRGSWALMLRYATPLSLPFDAAFVNDGPLRWIARDCSKPGRERMETWLLHATAEWSEAHMEDSSEQVAEALLAAFSALGGAAPVAWTAHRWRYADSLPALEDECAWDDSTRLGMCGDWLNGGKVEGAWLGGRALARRVAASFS
ncbi:FAD-dependent oxidoreductase [Zoogloea sp.]|uniref:NAD(P)/FAD-dependent oxidoreductase n=1 Tax=Zoogloea sp. TaxID=49181 RepID=UPI002629698E|nr:FAD-dependent oxidoreductase [Zoogloea sp.]MDD3354133.1 FAD-dependent oxidoreductase [Zoogloea sp.]